MASGPRAAWALHAVLGVVGLFLGAAGCAEGAAARPQIVLVVDTDTPVPGLVRDRDDIDYSGDAAVDTLRVDVLEPAAPSRTFVAPEVADWPISFGVVVPRGVSSIRLRLRAFRSQFAAAGLQGDEETLDPPPGVTIDRIVDLAQVNDGIARRLVRLHGDCFGARPSFGSPPETCVDGASRAGAPTDAITTLSDDELPATTVGSWAASRALPCSEPAPEGAVCIPGGVTILGHQAFVGWGDGSSTVDAVPLVAVRLSPFFLDRTETTVGTLRSHIAEISTPPIVAGDPAVTAGEYCTWLGADDGANDALPVNCVTYATAEAACAALGGALPTEAQWEHAARGRGQRRLFPWGDEPASCCVTSASRKGPPDIAVECGPAQGIQPVGSHPAGPECGGLGDESRDGVLDLGGSVVEAMRDALQPFDAPCWSEPDGLRVDPSCTADSPARSARGGFWNGGLQATAAPFRVAFAPQRPSQGFRCAYPAGAP